MSVISPYVHESVAQDLYKADYAVQAQALHFSNGQLVVPGTLFGLIEPFDVNVRALRQMAAKLGPVVFGKGSTRSVPVDYLQAMPVVLRDHVLNAHLAATESREWLVRAYNHNARAVLDRTYSPISNTEVLVTLDELLDLEPVPGFRVVSGSVLPDQLHFKTIWLDSSSANYGLGVYLGNNEVGEGMLKALPLIKRHSCDNSIIVAMDEGVIEWRHRGSAKAKLLMLKAKLLDVLKLSEWVLDRVLAAEFKALPNFNDVLRGIARDQKWEDTLATQVAIGTEGQETVMGLVNGVTFAAHTLPGLTMDARTDLEIFGGRILTAPDSLFGRAAQVGAE